MHSLQSHALELFAVAQSPRNLLGDPALAVDLARVHKQTARGCGKQLEAQAAKGPPLAGGGDSNLQDISVLQNKSKSHSVRSLAST